MNNEIKEILETFKKINEEYSLDTELDFEDYEIPNMYLKQLLDYITNLQEENKEWSMIFDTFSKRPYAHKYLEEKKKELGNKKIIGFDSEMIYKDYYDCKSRCEKAIEELDKYINSCEIEAQHTLNNEKCLISVMHSKKVKNILGGDE